MMEDALFLDVCRRQYRAYFAMLRKALEGCPDSLWDRRANGSPFWQQAHHALKGTDFYLSESPDAFESRSFDGGRPADLGEQPDNAPCREEVLGYLDAVEAKFEALCERLASGGLDDENPFRWTGPTVAHRLVYNLRHAEHHLGWMAAILRGGGEGPLAWVCTA